MEDQYIVLDTNVLVSGLFMGKTNRETPPKKIVDLILSGEITLFYSDETFAEYKEVLSRKKFNFSKRRIKRILQLIEILGVKIRPFKAQQEIKDPKDVPFFNLVTSVNTLPAYLVTGNLKHFPATEYIVSPAAYCTELEYTL